MKTASNLSTSINLSAYHISIPLLILLGSAVLCAWQVVKYIQVCQRVEFFEQERSKQRETPLVEETDELDQAEDEEEDAFPWVNRTPDYLKKRAVSFAQKYHVSESVKKLYRAAGQEIHDKDSPEEKKRYKKNAPHQNKRKKQAKKVSEQKYARTFTPIDPRFNLPIDRDNFWLSSPFGLRRRSGGKREFHGGIDMAAVRGTPVKAAADGVVVQAGHQAGYGNVVVIRHEDGFKTRYAHLSKILIAERAQVKVGQVIGKVGATGNARASGKTRDASHLHFEVEKQGKRVNPYYFFK